jgi:hypothetical protein
MTMEIASFDDLVRAASAQPEPQRLLFVFASAEVPDDCTPEQRANFEAGQGGALVPLMSVDKQPDELSTFTALAEESRQFAPSWDIVFVASLAGREGRAPSSADADLSLQRMIESIKAGAFGAYLPFNAAGEPVVFD